MSETQRRDDGCPCPKHPFGCYGHPDTCGCETVSATPPKPAPDALREALKELVTHKEAWRQIIDDAREDASSDRDDMDEKGYLAHELQAFDKAFVMIEAALSPAPVPPADGVLDREEKYLLEHFDAECGIMPGDVQGSFHRIRAALASLPAGAAEAKPNK